MTSPLLQRPSTLRVQGNIRLFGGRYTLHPRARNRRLQAEPLPEGNLGLPLIGETLQLLSQGDTFGEQRSAQHGDMWKTNILGSPTIMVFGEAECRKLLKEEGHLVEVIWPDVTAELVGTQSLNLLKGEEHLRIKRVLGEAFSEEAVETLHALLQDCTRLFCDRWAELGSFSADDEGKLWAWTVFGSAVLGLTPSIETGERLCGLMDTLQAGFQTAPVKLPLTPYQKATKAREAIADLVQQQMQAVSGSEATGPSCLATMMAGQQLTSTQIVDNVVAAAFGNASAGPSAAKAFQHLAAAGHVRDRLAEQASTQSDNYPHQPDYTLAVVREVLRITPIVPALFRRALQDFPLGGRLVPKGWSVYIHTGASVQKYNRDTFQPERWLKQSNTSNSNSATPPGREVAAAGSGGEEAVSGRRAVSEEMRAESMPERRQQSACPEHSLPFGLGPRMCLGRHLVEAALALLATKLASSYEWQMAHPAEEWSVFPTVRPKHGLMVQSFRRHDRL